jgi:ABC-type polysaccharide/polyol phosphate transport system ATPase subunit
MALRGVGWLVTTAIRRQGNVQYTLALASDLNHNLTGLENVEIIIPTLSKHLVDQV